MEDARTGEPAIAALVDSGVLYALTDGTDDDHDSVRRALESEREAVIVPQPVLPEVCYLLNSRRGPEVELRFLDALAGSDWALEPLVEADFVRIRAVLETYRTADIGFVDAGMVAVAERLGVTRIYTLDHRDFGLVRPAHAERFTLLP